MSELTQERLKELLRYDSETGVFTWLRTLSNRALVGSVAGCLHPHGYHVIRLEGRLYKRSRLAWLYVNGVWPEPLVDHINRVRGDDRISNLREATVSENAQNKRPAKNMSGIRGVTLCKVTGRWQAYIGTPGKHHHLGYFTLKEEAAAAYVAAATRLHTHNQHAAPSK